MAQADLNAFYKATGPLEARQQLQQTKMGDLQIANAKQGLETGKFDNEVKKNDLTMKIISTVRDQGSYTRALDIAGKYGLDVSTLPQEYDPQIVDQIGRATMTYAEQLNQQFRQDQLGLSRDKLNLDREKMTGGFNEPAASKLTTRYLKAIEEGNTDEANALVSFAKTRDKNFEYDAQGNLAPIQGITQGLQDIEFAKSQGKAEGKGEGDAVDKYKNFQAQLPSLEQSVGELYKLAPLATYNFSGKSRDAIRRETGQDVGSAAEAAVRYETIVKATILPTLKDTFGGAMSITEGEWLIATLGSIDMAPEEKAAAIDARVQGWINMAQTNARRVGAPEPQGLFEGTGFQPQQQAAPDVNDGQTATNPETGEKIVFKNGQWGPM